MTKYRIKKVVSYVPEWDAFPKVCYKIEWKRLWWWEPLNEVLGCKNGTCTFNSLEEAEAALKKHAKFRACLETDNKIEKVLKL